MKPISVLIGFALSLSVLAQENSSLCERKTDFLNARGDRYAFSFVGSVKGIQIVEKMFDDKGSSSETTHILKFDNNGRLTETFLSTSKIPRFGRTLYVYDQLDQIIRLTDYNPDGSAVFERIYTYTPAGNLESRLTRNAISKKLIGSKTEYKYESPTSFVEFSDGKFVRRIKLKKDDKCRVIERILTKENNELENILTLKYDSRGNVIEDIAYSPTGKPAEKLKWEFEYDERGNWIRMSFYEWHYWDKTEAYTLTSVETRTITYANSK